MLVRNGHPNFYRWLHNPLFEEWLGIVEKTYSFNFSSQKDIVTWKWNSKKTFTTKSVYNRLSSGSESNRFNHIWKSKIPYKIKIFTWLLEKGAVLTKDNMIRRRWAGDPSCKFCDQPETINHLFFQCLVAKCIWALIGKCLGANIPREIVNSISNGLGNGCLTGKLLITSVLRQFAGPSGNAAIKQSLMLNSSGTLPKFCYTHVLP